MRIKWLSILLLLGLVLSSGGVELTFELPDNAKECFYQEIEKNVTSTLEFQVSFEFSYGIVEKKSYSIP